MSKKAARGRPRSFDKEEVLRLLMNEFWVKGFAATSLDDLSAATGLSRPSLYAAYGGKTDMYLSSMEAFGKQMQEAAFPALFGDNDLRSALTGFYVGALDIYFGKTKQSFGCLVFTTAVADAAVDTRIKKAVSGFVRRMDEALTTSIATRCAHLSDDEAKSLAQLAGGMLINLATRARAGAKRSELDKIAKASAALIARAANPSSK